MQLVISFEQSLHALAHARFDPRNEDGGDVVFDLGEHRFVIWTKVVVLRAQHDGFNALRCSVVFVLNRHLTLRVWTQVRHFLTRLANGRKLSQQAMRQLQRQRHVVVRFATRIPKHHPLISRTLLFRLRAFHALIDVFALFVNRTQHATRRGIKLVFASRVPDVRDGLTRDGLHIEVGRVGLHLPCQHHLSRGHKRFTSHLGIGIKRQEMVNQGIADRVCHLVWMAFGYRFRSEEITHLARFR